MLGLLWNLAHSDDVPTDIMDQALTAHIKILDYSCSQVLSSVYSLSSDRLNLRPYALSGIDQMRGMQFQMDLNLTFRART